MGRVAGFKANAPVLAAALSMIHDLCPVCVYRTEKPLQVNHIMG